MKASPNDHQLIEDFLIGDSNLGLIPHLQDKPTDVTRIYVEGKKEDHYLELEFGGILIQFTLYLEVRYAEDEIKEQYKYIYVNNVYKNDTGAEYELSSDEKTSIELKIAQDYLQSLDIKN